MQKSLSRSLDCAIIKKDMRFVSRTKFGIILVMILVFFLVLNLTGLGKGVKNFFYGASSCFQASLWQAGDSVSEFFGGVFEAKKLKEEVENLKVENQELLSQLVNLNDLKKENRELREALNIGLEKEFQLEIAKVIGKDPSRDSLLINKGFEHGISKDMPVITSQKSLLGRIGEVYNKYSEVILISSKKSSLDAKLIKKEVEEGKISEEVDGVLRGKGSFEICLELIPKEKEISPGELVITASLSGIFPYGLLVGEVEEVKKSDVEAFQQAKVKPAFNLESLCNLFIITKF